MGRRWGLGVGVFSIRGMLGPWGVFTGGRGKSLTKNNWDLQGKGVSDIDVRVPGGYEGGC